MRFYTAGVNKALYVLLMNQHKSRVHQDTKEKLYKNFVEECRQVVEYNKAEESLV